MRTSDFEAAFDEHKDAVYRFAWRMTASASQAEDIAQEVFLALLRTPGRFDSTRGSLRPFLLGIARNLVLKKWRDEDRWDELDDDAFSVAPIDLEREELSAIVARTIRALPPLQREALILAEYEELSLQDIARAVGTDIGTVKSRLHRARENLRRALAPLKPHKASEVTNP